MPKLLIRLLTGLMIAIILPSSPANAQQPTEPSTTASRSAIMDVDYTLPAPRVRIEVLNLRSDPDPLRIEASAPGMLVSFRNGSFKAGFVACSTSNLLSSQWQSFRGVKREDCTILGGVLRVPVGPHSGPGR
ncbi:MAG: hypothetical protein QOE22_325 [Candidatus Parcubacteria bacterium]|jgi:hypothetical protein|nr:hypothetical protein [Candidatus Parcubacteria bacterium]